MTKQNKLKVLTKEEAEEIQDNQDLVEQADEIIEQCKIRMNSWKRTKEIAQSQLRKLRRKK